MCFLNFLFDFGPHANQKHSFLPTIVSTKNLKIWWLTSMFKELLQPRDPSPPATLLSCQFSPRLHRGYVEVPWTPPIWPKWETQGRSPLLMAIWSFGVLAMQLGFWGPLLHRSIFWGPPPCFLAIFGRVGSAVGTLGPPGNRTHEFWGDWFLFRNHPHFSPWNLALATKIWLF